MQKDYDLLKLTTLRNIHNYQQQMLKFNVYGNKYENTRFLAYFVLYLIKRAFAP